MRRCNRQTKLNIFTLVYNASGDITRNNSSTNFLYPQFIASKIKEDKTKRVFWLTSILLFVNCTVSVVVTGTTFQKLKEVFSIVKSRDV